tara:strand:- start:284 stop:451 length:168 start_codon:yes stop_codon:yes gene_type:complete
VLLDVEPTGHYSFKAILLDKGHSEKAIAYKLLKKLSKIVWMIKHVFPFSKLVLDK